MSVQEKEKNAARVFLEQIGYNPQEWNAESIKSKVLQADLNDAQTVLVLDFIESVKALETGTASFNPNFMFSIKDNRLQNIETKIFELLANQSYRTLAQSTFRGTYGFLVDELHMKFEYYVTNSTPGSPLKDLEYYLFEQAKMKNTIKDIEAYNELPSCEKQNWLYAVEFDKYIYDYYSTW